MSKIKSILAVVALLGGGKDVAKVVDILSQVIDLLDKAPGGKAEILPSYNGKKYRITVEEI